MRPNNQNKNRQRGRNGGRKHVNPLSRNFESNGPDVKVRGNAAHIAEKYLQLARDAQSSGDSVMAENYLQHAEHYFRIVSSAQQAQNGQRPEGQDDDFDDDMPDMNSRFAFALLLAFGLRHILLLLRRLGRCEARIHIGHIIIEIVVLAFRTLAVLGLLGAGDDAEIVLGVLEIILRHHRIA